jgi:bla regulator protein BlaR1
MTSSIMFDLRRILLSEVVLLIVCSPIRAQVVEVFHPTGPMPSFEVATIKKADSGGGPRNGRTIKSYIRTAYAVGLVPLSEVQIVGGPAWIDKGKYVINGKEPDELRDAMQKMKPEERANQHHMMLQSLLTDRLKLKVHFETRELPIYNLTVARGGLKIKEVPPPSVVPAGSPPGPAASDDALRPGMVVTQLREGGIRVMNARATTMIELISALSFHGDVSDKPIVDKTAFTGSFDVVDMQWAELTAQGSGGDGAVPSLFTALEEKLGLKLVATKDQVEVVVIDMIETPSDN